jgi:HEAT repeat protein
MNAPPRSPAPARARVTPDQARRAADAVGAALLALSRAARSVLLYDAANATVHQHVSDYQSRMRAALALGDMALTIGPFQVLANGQAVYSDTDREKSLPFRLYRDGLRGVRFQADVPWEELLAFLEIIAIRYTGVRQQEEDAVTLLRKADFRRISVEYVEGFTPAEEVPEPVADDEVERAQRQAPPASWDTPLPALPAPGPLDYRAIPEAALAELTAEDREDAIAGLAVSVARELVGEALRGSWRSGDADLLAFFDELREGLLAEGNLLALRQVLDALNQSGAAELRDRMLRALGEPRVLEIVLSAIPAASQDLPRELEPVLPLLGSGPILEQLTTSNDPRRRRLLVQLVERRLPRDADALLARLPQLDAVLVRDLGRAVVTRAPEKTAEIARQLLSRKDDEKLRLAALTLLEASPSPLPLRPVWELLEDASETVRVRAIEVLGRRADERVIDPLRALLESSRAMTPEAAEAIGCALAELAPLKVAGLFAGWLHPKKGLLGRITAQQRLQQWAAVAGLALTPGDSAEATLQGIAEHADADLRRHCMKALARRKAAARGR